MDSKTNKILQHLSTEKVDLFSISQAKGILKDDFQDKVSSHTKIFKSNIDDLKSFERKSDDARQKLIAEQKKEVENLQSNQNKQVEKYINTLSSEVKEARGLIKSIDKKVQKHKSTLKEFEQQLKELGIKPSSSKLYEEIDSAIFIMNFDAERLKKSIDFVENSNEYKSNI